MMNKTNMRFFASYTSFAVATLWKPVGKLPDNLTQMQMDEYLTDLEKEFGATVPFMEIGKCVAHKEGTK